MGACYRHRGMLAHVCWGINCLNCDSCDEDDGDDGGFAWELAGETGVPAGARTTHAGASRGGFW